MDFDLNEMQQMLVDSAQRLVRTRSDVETWRAHREFADGVDPAIWSRFAELGWLALAVPEDAGGLGGSMEDVALLMIELGRGIVVEPIVSSAVLGAHLIGASGCAGREALLGAIVGGELRLALAHLEADDTGAETGPRKTTARREGDGYVLSGAKVLAYDAPSAGRLIVTAALEDGTGLFLVDAGASGVALESYAMIDGSHAADVALSDVAVSADALLASGSEADAVLAEALDRARIATMAQAIGAMEGAVTTTADYAKERQQFGQPIARFQAIQHMGSEMFAAMFEARSALYQALADCTESTSRRQLAVSIAKAKSTEAGQIVGRNGIQIHGGYGITDEYAVSHFYRRLFTLEKQYGDADWHLARIAALS